MFVLLVAHLVNQETVYVLGILGVRFTIILLKQSVQIAACLGIANSFLLAFCLDVYNFHSNNRVDVDFVFHFSKPPLRSWKTALRQSSGSCATGIRFPRCSEHAFAGIAEFLHFQFSRFTWSTNVEP